MLREGLVKANLSYHFGNQMHLSHGPTDQLLPFFCAQGATTTTTTAAHGEVARPGRRPHIPSQVWRDRYARSALPSSGSFMDACGGKEGGSVCQSLPPLPSLYGRRDGRFLTVRCVKVGAKVDSLAADVVSKIPSSLGAKQSHTRHTEREGSLPDGRTDAAPNRTCCPTQTNNRPKRGAHRFWGGDPQLWLRGCAA